MVWTIHGSTSQVIYIVGVVLNRRIPGELVVLWIVASESIFDCVTNLISGVDYMATVKGYNCKVKFRWFKVIRGDIRCYA